MLLYIFYGAIECTTRWATPNLRYREQLYEVQELQLYTTVRNTFCYCYDPNFNTNRNPNPKRLDLLCRSMVPKETWSGWDRRGGVDQS